MHQTKRYSDPDPKVNEAKAIKDCKFWLGKDDFEKVKKLLASYSVRQNCYILLEFRGIQGYTAKVLVDKFATNLKD